MAPSIEIQQADESADTPEPPDLRAWAEAALAAIAQPGIDADAELTIRVVGEEEGRALNRDFRGCDYPTNVLSFPFGEIEPEALAEVGAYLGDLVICAPVVRREAAEQGKPLPAHWTHMVVHGVLHLAGYDHQDEDEAMDMEAQERRILAGLGLSDPYAAINNEVSDGQAHG
ncbi:MAG: rRNA maturation RNase YbeY [Halofilum sp. (in: g-proteobacteria)]